MCAKLNKILVESPQFEKTLDFGFYMNITYYLLVEMILTEDVSTNKQNQHFQKLGHPSHKITKIFPANRTRCLEKWQQGYHLAMMWHEIFEIFCSTYKP